MPRRAWLAVAAGLLALLAGPALAQPSDLPTEPMLRINAASHIGVIHRISTDTKERFAVTASEDKTVRVWSLPDGKLQRTIWLPAGDGNVGKAYAVALSPDGATIAIGGLGPIGINIVYLFDRASGTLTRRLPNLPDTVNDLAFSPDGAHLAVAIHGANGIRIFDAGDAYQPLPSDNDYGDSCYSLDFDRDSQLVSASDDGFVRLYAPSHYDKPVVPKTRVKGMVDPFSVAFSPDGRRIAVGDYHNARVAILRDGDLALENFPAVRGFDDTGLAVAWSQDGQRLFAGGIHREAHQERLARRWDNAGTGAFVDITGAKDTVSQYVSLSGQRMLFADARGFGLIDDAGKAIRLQDKGSIDVRRNSASDTILIGPEARTVQVGDLFPRRVLRFDLTRRAVAVDPSPGGALSKPITGSTKIKLTDWEDNVSPKVNGLKLDLEKDEVSRSVALVPGTDFLVLGADWHLRLFDSKGKQIWSRATPGAVWGVNVSADGRLIVAAYNDGTIRWHRVSDGEELLALFIHPDGQRWIAWTPQGYYDASAGADDLIGWQVNHGYDQAPDFFPTSQFQQRFNRRDVIARVLDTLDVDKALAEANKAAGAPVAKAAPLATSALTPVVEIKDPAPNGEQTSRELSISYVARMTTPDPIERVEALVDGVTVKSQDIELLTQGDKRVGSLRLTMPLHDAKISVIAYNANGASQPASVQVLWRGPGREDKPKLYVLAIGVTRYKATGLPEVHFPAKDAHDFVALAKAEEGGLLYGKVVPYPEHESLEDEHATHDAILDGLDWIEHAVENSNDVAMVFLSGHGINTPDQQYHFLPYDYDPKRIDRTTISGAELKGYITKIGGKTLFFFDTCFSGNVLPAKDADTKPDVDGFANELRTAKNGVVVFTSSTGDELSLELPGLNNGAFTKAVVDGMRGAAARSGSSVISIADLESYVSHRVHDLTGGNQHPSTAKPTTIPDYWIASVIQ
jgi:WD40 repeat protein